MKKLFGVILICVLLVASISLGAVTTDSDITGIGGGVSEGTDVGFGNITATSIRLGNGSSSSPSVAIGDDDTGFYESVLGTVSFTTNGNLRWFLSGSYLGASNLTGGPLLAYVAATATAPNFRFQSDVDTGIGHAGADQLSLIAGGIEALRNYTTYSEFYPSGTGQVIIRDDGSIEISGIVTFSSMTTIFGDYSAINNMNQILCDATSGDVDIHIVSASGAKGRIGNVKKIDASGNNCIIEPAGAETIDGVANKSISTQWGNLTYFSDNTNLLIR